MIQSSKRLDNIDYFYFFIVIIYAAMAVPATKSMVRPYGGITAYIIPWGLTILMAVKHRIKFENIILLRVLSIYGLWVVLQTIKYNYFYDGSFIFLGNIIIAYVLIKIYDVRMISLYERIVVSLSVIAIIGWTFQVLTPGLFTTFMETTSIYTFKPGETIIANNIFFSLTDYSRSIDSGGILPRNAGFSWEAGRYASMVIFAIFFNLAQCNFKLKNNYSFWILFIALLTTQSTTGYMALLFLALIMVVNKKNAILKPVYVIFFLVPLVAVFISLPFMGEKISDLLSNEKRINRIMKSAEWRVNTNTERLLVPQRFDSLVFHVMNTQHDPILGYGIAPLNSYVKSKIAPFISPTGGIIEIFAQFGIIIGFLVYSQLYRSSKYFSEYFQYKGNWMFLLLFALLSISYSFWIVPFYSSLWMFPLFKKS